MNFLSIIYFSQYYELKHSGRDPLKGRLNGNLLCAVIIILNMVSLGLILHKFSPHNIAIQWITGLFTGYEGDGKAMGKLIGLLIIAVIGGLLWLTIGSEKSYLRIADRFLQLPDDLQKKTIRQALIIFLVSFAGFLFCIFLL
ncbi:MAG: hypothetical protein ABJA78_03310 [Ferruginibacter sp.]